MYDTVQCVTSMILVVGTIEVVSVINLSKGSRAHCKFVFSPSLCIDTLVTGMSGTGNGALQKQGPCDSCKLSLILKESKLRVKKVVGQPSKTASHGGFGPVGWKT